MSLLFVKPGFQDNLDSVQAGDLRQANRAAHGDRDVRRYTRLAQSVFLKHSIKGL
jgi:hypothetical protein